LRPSSSRCKDLRGEPQRDPGRTLGTMCTCKVMERGTHAHRASKLGPLNGSGIRTGKWEPRFKTPPQSPENGHTYCILLIRIVFCHLSRKVSLCCLLSVTVNIYFFFYFNIARDAVTVLLIFVDIYHFNYTFSHAHI